MDIVDEKQYIAIPESNQRFWSDTEEEEQMGTVWIWGLLHKGASQTLLKKKHSPDGGPPTIGDERGPPAVLTTAQSWPPWRGIEWTRTIRVLLFCWTLYPGNEEKPLWPHWTTCLLSTPSIHRRINIIIRRDKGNILETCKVLDRNQRPGKHWYSVASSCYWLGFENRGGSESWTILSADGVYE